MPSLRACEAIQKNSDNLPYESFFITGFSFLAKIHNFAVKIIKPQRL